MLIFINFLALRQAVTPAPLLGRMTSTMRWLILMPAGPGALLGGWLGEHSACARRWRSRGRCAAARGGGDAPDVIRNLRACPRPSASRRLGAEADVRAQPAAT